MLNFENSLTNYQLKGASGQWIASWINSKEKKKKYCSSLKRKELSKPRKDMGEPKMHITKTVKPIRKGKLRYESKPDILDEGGRPGQSVGTVRE